MNEELNVEVLEELQNRYLVFALNDGIYAISLASIIEIVNIQNITRIPHAVPYVKGIVNLRGRVFPVIDLRMKLEVFAKPYDDMTSIVMIDVDNNRIGLIVDKVYEVRTILQEQLAEPPESQAGHNHCIEAVTESEGNHILIIDCERLLCEDIEL